MARRSGRLPSPRWPDLLERVKVREAAFRKPLHPELARLVEEDQAERRNVRREDWAARWPEIRAHDEAHQQRAEWNVPPLGASDGVPK